MAQIDGTAGNDLIDVRSEGSTTVYAGDGNDTVLAGAGFDFLYGETGSDALRGGSGWDVLDGGAGDDDLDGGSFGDSLLGGAGNDVLHGAGDFDTLDGGDGNDTLYGDASDISSLSEITSPVVRYDDTLDGGAGDDVLWGDWEGDRLTGGAGNDSLDGGDDIDRAVFTGARTQYTVQFVSGAVIVADQVAARDGTDRAASIELFEFSDGVYTWHDLETGATTPSGGGLLIVGSDYPEYIVADDGPDLIYGNGGGDIIHGAAGDDSVSGGADDDEIHGEAGDDYLDGNGGDDVIYGNAGENTLLGQQGNDQLYGGSGADAIVGDTGNDVLLDNDYGTDDAVDWLDGGSGDDYLSAGYGDHVDGGSHVYGDYIVLTYRDAPVAMYVDLRPMLVGMPSIVNDGSIVNVESASITGSAFNDFLAGLSATNGIVVTTDGFFGNDTLRSGNGYDQLVGGQGTDTVVVTGASNEYTLAWQAAVHEFVLVDLLGRDGTDTLTGVEFLQFSNMTLQLIEPATEYHGTDAEDLHVGSDGRDAMDGAGGNDWLQGMGGNDTLSGSAGDDRLTAGNGDDVLVGGAGNDYLEGGAGLDVAQFDVGIGSYSLGWSAFDILLTSNANAEQYELVSDVERLVFTDLSLAFDFDGNAGHALRFLGAVIGPESVLSPASVGLALGAVDAGWSDADISQAAASLVYGAYSDADFVQDMHRNLFGTDATPSGLDGIVALLHNGAFTRATMIEYVINQPWLDAFVEDTADLLGDTGLLYVHTGLG